MTDIVKSLLPVVCNERCNCWDSDGGAPATFCHHFCAEQKRYLKMHWALGQIDSKCVALIASIDSVGAGYSKRVAD